MAAAQGVQCNGSAIELDEASARMVLSVSQTLHRLKTSADLSALFAIGGMFLNFVAREIYDSDSTNYVPVAIIRSFTTLLTAALLYWIFQYHKAEFSYFKLSQAYLSEAICWNSQKIVMFIFEVCLCIVHEPPFLDIHLPTTVRDLPQSQDLPSVYFHNPWCIIMLLRFYLLLRLLTNRFYTNGTKILGMWNNFSFNSSFAVRNLLFTSPLMTLLPAMLFLLIVGSYMLHVCERDSHEGFDMLTGGWIIVITMFGVGYGELYPYTTCGRFVTMTSAFLTLILTAVVVAAVHRKLILFPYELRMVEFLERSHNAKLLRNRAVAVIAAWWRYHKGKQANSWRQTWQKRHLVSCIFQFQNTQITHYAYNQRYNSDQMLRTMIEKMQERLDVMNELLCLSDMTQPKEEELSKEVDKVSSVQDPGEGDKLSAKNNFRRKSSGIHLPPLRPEDRTEAHKKALEPLPILARHEYPVSSTHSDMPIGPEDNRGEGQLQETDMLGGKCPKCGVITNGEQTQDSGSTNVDVSVLVGDSRNGSGTQRLLLEINERLRKLEDFVGD